MHLSAIGQLPLLKELFVELHIPTEVYEEVVVSGAGKPGADEVREATWIKTYAVDNQLAMTLLASRLGVGESATIVLAQQLHADLLLLDDRSARAQAESIGLKVVGTVGVLLRARLEENVDDFPRCLDGLRRTGFRLSQGERQRILALWEALRRDR